MARLLLLIPLALVVACTAAPTPAPDDVPRVAVEGGDALYARSYGAGEEGVLVLGAAWFEADLPILTGNVPAITYVDLRGRGRSTMHTSAAAVSLEGDVRDLEEVRQALGYEQMSILARSYEAAVALHYAHAYPDRVKRLLLVSPLPMRRSPHWDEFERTAIRRSSREDLERLQELRRGGAQARRTTAYHRALLAATFRSHGADTALVEAMQSNPYPPPHDDPDAVAMRRQALFKSLGDWDWSAIYSGIETPVLIVGGADGSMPRVALEELAEALPTAQYLPLSFSAFPWLENPDLFLSTVIRVLRH